MRTSVVPRRQRFSRAGVLLILLLGMLSGPAVCGEAYDISLDDGKIAPYTLQLLPIWEVEDEEGLARIHRLHPPSGSAEVRDDLAWFNRLRLWLREKSSHGPAAFRYPLYPPSMIERLRHDEEYSATCGPFSVAYAGLLLAHDIPVRLVHIFAASDTGELSSHTFNEVWSEHHQKWVVQDVDLNCCWLASDGSPLSALELQQAMCGPGTKGLEVAAYRTAGEKMADFPVRRELFYRLVIAFQSNYFRAQGIPYLQYQRGSLVHCLREGEQADARWRQYAEMMAIQVTRDQGLLSAPVNQIEIQTVASGEAIRFTFSNNMLNFDQYEVSVGKSGWETLAGDAFSLPTKHCDQGAELRVRGVSGRGHRTKAFAAVITRKHAAGRFGPPLPTKTRGQAEALRP